MRVVLVGLLLVCAGCASIVQRSGPPIDPTLLMLVPADSTSLAWIKMEKLVKTAGYTELAKSGTVGGALDLIAAQTTYDPRKDIWELLIVSNGAQSVMLARGKYAALGMDVEFKKEGTTRSDYHGQSLVASGGVVLTFISSSCLAIGTRQSLEWLVDARAGKRLAVPPSLMALADKMDRKNQVWWASTAPAAMIPAKSPVVGGAFGNILTNLPRLLSGVNTLTGEMDFSAGLALSLHAGFVDEAHARESSGAMNGFLAIAQATAPKQKELLDSMKISTSGADVAVTFQVPIAQVAKLVP